MPVMSDQIDFQMESIRLIFYMESISIQHNLFKIQRMNSLRQVKEAQKCNKILQLSEIAQWYPEFEVVSTGKYFPYDNIYKDGGWGCAWRAIQLMLTAHKVENEQIQDFKWVFQKFSRKQELTKIVKQKKSFGRIPQNLLQSQKWAPQENANNWAEPFIGQIICENFNLSTELALVNGFPKAYAPEEFFQSTIDFEIFWSLIKKTIPYSPLMIDDGLYALSIIGYFQQSENRKHLLLADPHIESNGQFGTAGIYKVVLDEKGNQLGFTFLQKEAEKQNYPSYNQINFATKKWMVLRVLVDK